MPTIAELNAKYSGATIIPQPQQPGLLDKAENLVTGIGQGIIHPLVYAGSRIAQAGVQTYNMFQNPGYDTPVDYGNPQRQNAGGTATPLPVNAPTPTTTTNNSEAKLKQPQQVLGMAIPPQYGGAKGVEQIGGQALEDAVAIAGAKGVGAPAPGMSFLPKLVVGTGVGAGYGQLLGTAQGMEEGGDINQIATQGVKGAGLGALTGGILTGASEVPQIFNRTPTPIMNPAEVNTGGDIAKMRLQDATPSYDKSMVTDRAYVGEGENLQNMPRVNEGKGLFGSGTERTVNPNNSEIAAGQELAKLKNYPDKGTALQKSQAIYDSIKQEAEGLRGSLQAEDKTAPLVKGAKEQIYKNIFDRMDGDARTAVITRGKGMEFEKAGLSEADAQALAGGKAPRSALGKYGTDVADAMSEYNGTREGILDLRQKLDAIYEEYRGKHAWGTDTYNALDDMHKQIRDYLNQELHESTTNADVKASFERQKNLFRAKDVLDSKAQHEAVSDLGRIIQKHPSLGMIKNILMRQGIRLPLEIAGVTGAGYAINKALKGK